MKYEPANSALSETWYIFLEKDAIILPTLHNTFFDTDIYNNRSLRNWYNRKGMRISLPIVIHLIYISRESTCVHVVSVHCNSSGIWNAFDHISIIAVCRKLENCWFPMFKPIIFKNNKFPEHLLWMPTIQIYKILCWNYESFFSFS